MNQSIMDYINLNQDFSYFLIKTGLISHVTLTIIEHKRLKIIAASMFEEDQGFANDIKTELVQVNFIPLLPPKKHQHKPLLTPLMLHSRKIGAEQLSSLNAHIQQLKGQKSFECLNEDLILRNKKLARKGGGSITFQSSFDNGNLQQVKFQKGIYHLFIRPDSNTKSHCQWFYFIAKTKEKTHANFVLHNFAKRNMLYRRGLRPYYRSIKLNQTSFSQIDFQSEYTEDEDQEEQQRYCLKFSFEFCHADEVQFCSQPPYNFQRLTNISIPSFFRRVQLTRSLLGQPIYGFFVNEKAKGTVVVFARQHPGESVGSWMMEGLMKKLFNCDPTVSWILVPMLNVDGVKIGNNRTSLLGYDLNRCWDIEENPLRQHLFPELMGVIKYFRQEKKRKDNGIKMFIDLHGHSSEPNVFSYGPPHIPESIHFTYSRLFPYLISLNSKAFNLQQCSYELPLNKRNCARSFFFSKLGFPYSYTIESSFGIYNNKKINENDILQVGEEICISIIKFVTLLTKKSNNKELQKNIKDMQNLPPLLFSHKCESSDSDFDDQTYKQTQISKSSSKILIGKILNSPIRKNFWADISQQELSVQVRDLSIQEKKGRRSQRQQTQQVKDRYKSHRQGETEKSKHILPPIKNLKLHFPVLKKANDQLKRKLSLKEVTDKLISLRHNKIGRRIVILNDYPTSFH